MGEVKSRGRRFSIIFWGVRKFRLNMRGEICKNRAGVKNPQKVMFFVC